MEFQAFSCIRKGITFSVKMLATLLKGHNLRVTFDGHSV